MEMETEIWGSKGDYALEVVFAKEEDNKIIFSGNTPYDLLRELETWMAMDTLFSKIFGISPVKIKTENLWKRKSGNLFVKVDNSDSEDIINIDLNLLPEYLQKILKTS
jgi:hypothetical protein